MTRRIASQTALLAFAATLGAGLLSGNPPTTILTRALLALGAGFVLGAVAAQFARVLIRDHLQRRKIAIDEAHVAALAAAPAGNEPESTSETARG